MAKKKWKKKIGKALTAAATAYVASKMMKGKPTDYEWEASQIKKKVPFVEDIPSDYKHGHVPPMKGHPGGWNWESDTFSTPKGGTVKKTWKDWLPWKNVKGGTIKAYQGQLVKSQTRGTGAAVQGTTHEIMPGMNAAKHGKLIKARHGTQVRTRGSNPDNPYVTQGGEVKVATKLNGVLTTKTW